MREQYYQATTDRSHLQMTTAKGELIISLNNRALGANGAWSSLTLTAEQVEGLRKFLNEMPTKK